MSVRVSARRGRAEVAPGLEIETVALALRAEVRHGGFGVAATTPVAVHGGAGGESRVLRRPASWLAAALIRHQTRPEGEAPEREAPEREAPEREAPEREAEDDMTGEQTMHETLSRTDAVADALREAARGELAATPVTAGERTIIPLAETFFAGGFGGGFGEAAESGPAPGIGGGAGAGGIGRSRTVAVVVAGPEGVDVRPIVDTTSIVLAAIGAALGVLGVARHARRR